MKLELTTKEEQRSTYTFEEAIKTPGIYIPKKGCFVDTARLVVLHTESSDRQSWFIVWMKAEEHAYLSLKSTYSWETGSFTKTNEAVTLS
jgi:hypothetical protein